MWGTIPQRMHVDEVVPARYLLRNHDHSTHHDYMGDVCREIRLRGSVCFVSTIVAYMQVYVPLL